jgi:enoyl-CoA hydratase/carnithine racemase
VPERQFIKVDVSRETGVARLLLNRPDKRNALNERMLEEIHEALLELQQDEAIGVVVTSGAGKGYSAGRDIVEMRELHRQGPGHWYQQDRTREIIRAMRSAPQVMIAQVHGFCLGGAMALMIGHDLAVASDDASIGMPEVIRGSFGRTATSTLFHSGLPVKKAFFVSLTGRPLSGVEASRAGLVSCSVPAGELDSFVDELARDVASHSHAALEHAKIAAYLGSDVDLDHALQIDGLVSARQQLTTDPLADVEGYLRSQRGGTNVKYARPSDGG